MFVVLLLRINSAQVLLLKFHRFVSRFIYLKIHEFINLQLEKDYVMYVQILLVCL